MNLLLNDMYFDVFDLHTVTLIDRVRSVMLTMG